MTELTTEEAMIEFSCTILELLPCIPPCPSGLEDLALSHLSKTVDSVHGLCLHGGVPPRIHQHHMAECGKEGNDDRVMTVLC